MIKQYLTRLAEQDILTIFFTCAAIGIIGLICDFFFLTKRKHFAKKYLSKYKYLRHSKPFDEGCYQWLVHNATKMENEMGNTGRIDFYRLPYANYAFHNYDALSNTLLNIKRPAIANLEATQVLLERYIGALGYYISKKLQQLINPIVWLTRTVRFLLDVFLWMLHSFGLISGMDKNKVKTSSIVSKIIGMITFLGSLASLFAVRDSVAKFFVQIFG